VPRSRIVFFNLFNKFKVVTVYYIHLKQVFGVYWQPRVAKEPFWKPLI